MAITMRRGQLNDYDPTRMRSGEIAISTDNDTARQKTKVAFKPGVDKTVMFEEDFQASFFIDWKTGHLMYTMTKDNTQVKFDAGKSAPIAIGNFSLGDKYENSDIVKDTRDSSVYICKVPNTGVDVTNESYWMKLIDGKYINAAEESAELAKESAEQAKTNSDKSSENAKLAESYARGGTGTRTGEDTDNAKYYYELTKGVVAGNVPDGKTIVPTGNKTIAVNIDNNTIKSDASTGALYVDPKSLDIPDPSTGGYEPDNDTIRLDTNDKLVSVYQFDKSEFDVDEFYKRKMVDGQIKESGPFYRLHPKKTQSVGVANNTDKGISCGDNISIETVNGIIRQKYSDVYYGANERFERQEVKLSTLQEYLRTEQYDKISMGNYFHLTATIPQGHALGVASSVAYSPSSIIGVVVGVNPYFWSTKYGVDSPYFNYGGSGCSNISNNHLAIWLMWEGYISYYSALAGPYWQSGQSTNMAQYLENTFLVDIERELSIQDPSKYGTSYFSTYNSYYMDRAGSAINYDLYNYKFGTNAQFLSQGLTSSSVVLSSHIHGLTESQVFGTNLLSSSILDCGRDYKQLPGFKLVDSPFDLLPAIFSPRAFKIPEFWLRDSVSGTAAETIKYNGSYGAFRSISVKNALKSNPVSQQLDIDAPHISGIALLT